MKMYVIGDEEMSLDRIAELLDSGLLIEDDESGKELTQEDMCGGKYVGWNCDYNMPAFMTNDLEEAMEWMLK